MSNYQCTECDSLFVSFGLAAACHPGIGGVADRPAPGVTEIEPATEYDEDGFPHQVDPEGMEFDVTVCQMPGSCVHVTPAPLGFHMDCDPYSEREGAVWHVTFRLPTGELVCEDCCIEWEVQHG